MVGALLAATGSPCDVLEGVAREFSPRIEICGAAEITLDLSGLARLFGDARALAEALRRTAADRGLRVRVAIAATQSAARLLVHARAGITVVDPGDEAAALAPLPLALLDAITPPAPAAPRSAAAPDLGTPALAHPRTITPSHPVPAPAGGRPLTRHALTAVPSPRTETLKRWGLRTLGELAALPADAVAARLGQEAVEWQRLARGEDRRPLVPAVPEERFEQGLDLEWPIDGLEPLSFVLGRLMEPLEAHLARRDRGAAVLHVRLHLVDRTVHERSLQLPAPMRDARALRTLALLDLESHPPAAAIDRVVVAVDPTPGRVVQFSLLTRALPSPERLSTLMARLAAVMGEGRCGSPMAVDTWQPGAFAMKPFAPRDDEPARRGHVEPAGDDRPAAPGRRSSDPADGDSSTSAPAVALRRFRIPVPARVQVENGRPVRVTIDRRGIAGGHIETAAGPWRTSGAWWLEAAGPACPWDHDEWDIALRDGTTYRVFRERDSGTWFLEGVVD